MYNRILRYTTEFEEFVKHSAMSAQPADVENVLQKKGLWGNNKEGKFDTSSEVANVIFGILDRYPGSFKISTTLEIDAEFNVTIKVETSKSKYKNKIQSDIQSALGGKMSNALKESKLNPPADVLVMPWLKRIGY